MKGCVATPTGRITAGLKGLLVAAIALGLNACATGSGPGVATSGGAGAVTGRSTGALAFLSPKDVDLRLGQMTVAEALQRFGEPRVRTSTADSATVVNVTPGDQRPAGMRPPRVAGLIQRLTYMHGTGATGRILFLAFWNDRLYFHNFVSSVENESTNFDEGKITQIRRGATTYGDLVALLGNPSGLGVYPAVANPGNRLAVYQFLQINRQNRTIQSKRFDVLIDSRDIVVEYILRAVDQPVPVTIRR